VQTIVEDDNELADCALALIRRHGLEAADRTQHCASAHLAVGEDESGAFWSALAQTIRRMTLQPTRLALEVARQSWLQLAAKLRLGRSFGQILNANARMSKVASQGSRAGLEPIGLWSARLLFHIDLAPSGRANGSVNDLA
jgi:hypothetical protein